MFIMTPEKYFKKYGKIYGVSSKFEFGEWHHTVYYFKDYGLAEKWLDTEEYNFRERELMSKSAAIQLAGKESVDNAIDYQKELDEYAYYKR